MSPVRALASFRFRPRPGFHRPKFGPLLGWPKFEFIHNLDTVQGSSMFSYKRARSRDSGRDYYDCRNVMSYYALDCAGKPVSFVSQLSLIRWVLYFVFTRFLLLPHVYQSHNTCNVLVIHLQMQ